MDDRRKLCWECGGEVPQSAEQCPFCGAGFEVVNSAESDTDTFFSQSSKNTDFYSDSEPPKPLYQPIDERAPQEEGLDEEEEKSSGSARQQLICLCFLIPGFALLLFGIIMFFFSQEGYLTLKWDASWGMLIFALSALCIYFGAKAYKKL